MVPQDTPVLEASDGVLDPGSTSTMSAPCSVAQDLPLLLHRFLLGINEAPEPLPQCHPGVADASRR
jgi:hypothetical protein